MTTGNDPIHECNPHKLVTSKESQAMLANQSAQKPKKAKKPNGWMQPTFKIAVVCVVVGVFLFGLSYLYIPGFTDFVAGLPDIRWGKVSNLMVVVGTGLGALSAVSKKPSLTLSEHCALWGWALLFVASFVALVSPASLL